MKTPCWSGWRKYVVHQYGGYPARIEEDSACRVPWEQSPSIFLGKSVRGRRRVFPIFPQGGSKENLLAGYSQGIWRPENSVNFWNLLWLSRRLTTRTEQTDIYISTIPHALTSKKTQNNPFFKNRSLVSRTAITQKFKMLWFPNEARYWALKLQTDINLPPLMPDEDKNFRGSLVLVRIHPRGYTTYNSVSWLQILVGPFLPCLLWQCCTSVWKEFTSSPDKTTGN